MSNVVFIYDDTIETSNEIKSIIGKHSYGDIVIKRKKIYDNLYSFLKSIDSTYNVIRLFNKKDLDFINNYDNKSIFVHLFSNYPIIQCDESNIMFQKVKFYNENYIYQCNNEICGYAFCNKDDYLNYINGSIDKICNTIKCNSSFLDISKYNNLISFISSGFDARYFNSLEGDKYTVTKKSKDKNKMKMEYSYYWLLPEKMKSWMVMPYNFKEFGEYAQYTMERMPMTDIAIRWTHGAVEIDEFKNIMNKIFYFFKIRSEKNINKTEYESIQKKLYIDKVDDRIEKLKKCKEFNKIDLMIKSGTEYNSIAEIVKKYKELYKKITTNLYKQKVFKSVIGHGDVFFANMLYSKETDLLRLIDPKGALKEEELWTDPYYDIVKLSHSVCGNYDLFNTDSYDISLNKNMHFELKIFFDNNVYKEIFKIYLKENGYDYSLVRLYESSLFLSMLPLHIDNPHKVFGFILNAINILKELEEYV